MYLTLEPLSQVDVSLSFSLGKCVVSVPKWHFSLARAETGARGKLSYGGGGAHENKARVFILLFLISHGSGTLFHFLSRLRTTTM